jgi:hypothetical protein
MSTEDEPMEGETMYMEPIDPPYYFEVIVQWADTEPSVKELRGIRATWPPFADVSLKELKRALGAAKSVTIPRMLGRQDADELVARGKSLGLNITARSLDDEQ